MPEVSVVDSSAVLAFLQNEAGSQVVGPLLPGALLSTVNLSEVHAKLTAQGLPPGYSWRRILAMNCEICDLSQDQARAAAELITVTRPYGLSLGDRACIALALERKAKIFTADRVWKQLSLGVEVEVIR